MKHMLKRFLTLWGIFLRNIATGGLGTRSEHYEDGKFMAIKN